MLNDLFKSTHQRYRSLPLFGSVLEDFDEWLRNQGYGYTTRKKYVKGCTSIERYFWNRNQRSLAKLTPERMRKYRQHCRHRINMLHTFNCFERFLRERDLVLAPESPTPTSFSALVEAYRKHLMEVRGLAKGTIQHHCWRASEFLLTSQQHDSGFNVKDITRKHIENFITSVSSRFGRGSLQHVVAQLRGFLRFLSMRGELSSGQEFQIDTPRVYRFEQPPRALPWKTVCAFLKSIDRSDTRGLRDYAMFLLTATYGLRACDIAALRLTDIDWRAGTVRINQSKTKQPFILPLTDPVGDALVSYLRHGRPSSSYREIFLKVRAPMRPVRAVTVGTAFRRWVERSDLDIPFLGFHCLRHSYALHLLRQGVSLKNIGDVLGHRSTESTCVYLRLNLDDLREVALPLPCPSKKEV
jgi:integrase/recombinase XerD